MKRRSGILIALRDRLRPARQERGAALLSVILFMVMIAGMSLLMLGVLAGQAGPSLTAQKRTQTGYAAQAGLQATLNTIRSISHSTPLGVYGDRAKLPCTLTGKVDGSSSNLTYSVSIQYFAVDPTDKDEVWRTNHRIICIGGATLASQPAFAFILSKGIGQDVINETSLSGNRGIGAVYAFQLSNINIPGGLLLTSTTGFCVRAASATTGATLTFAPVANCTVAGTDKWVYDSDIEFKLASSENATYPQGLCITQGTRSGTTYPLTLQPCLPIPDPNRWNQLWSIDGGTTLWGQKNPISSGRSTVCLAFQNVYSGGVVQASTANCSGWAPDYNVGSGAASHSTNQVVNFGQFGRCMDVTEGQITYSYMIVWPCKQDPTGTGSGLNWNHKFYYTEAPALSGSQSTTIVTKVNNNAGQTYCLQTPDVNGSSVYPIFVGCDNSSRQQWTRWAKNDVSGYAGSWVFTDTYGRCITALDQDLYSSWIAKLGVANCSGSSLQKWNAPPYVSPAIIGGYKEIAG